MSTSTLTLEVFTQISSALTGVASEQLKPPVDPIGIADQYLAMLENQVGAATLDIATLDALVTTFKAQTDPAQGAAAILADPVLGPLGRSIIKLWLLGVWYGPGNPETALKVISSQAYKESLVWKIMQSHPMGYSMFSFGYWAEKPPALDKFVTLNSPASAPSKP